MKRLVKFAAFADIGLGVGCANYTLMVHVSNSDTVEHRVDVIVDVLANTRSFTVAAESDADEIIVVEGADITSDTPDISLVIGSFSQVFDEVPTGSRLNIAIFSENDIVASIAGSKVDADLTDE